MKKRLTPEELKVQAIEDLDLMTRVSNGDESSFRELSSRFGGLIYTTVHKVLNNVEDTKDVTQEVFLQIWKKADTYEPAKGKLMTWIATLSRNRAIDRLRSHQRRSLLRENVENETRDDREFSRESGHEHLYLSETRRMLRNAVMELTPEQREVIELAYFTGLTQTQIAEQLDRPLGTVKARIRRGVQNLRRVVTVRMDGDIAHGTVAQ